MSKDNDIEKYIYYVKQYMKHIENIDDKIYRLREWITKDHQTMHYDQYFLAKEIIRTKTLISEKRM